MTKVRSFDISYFICGHALKVKKRKTNSEKRIKIE